MENLNNLLENLAVSMSIISNNHMLLNEKLVLIKENFHEDPLSYGDKAVNTLKSFITCEEKNIFKFEEKLKEIDKYNFDYKYEIIQQLNSYLMSVKGSIENRKEDLTKLEELMIKARCSVNINMIVLLTLLSRLGGK